MTAIVLSSFVALAQDETAPPPPPQELLRWEVNVEVGSLGNSDPAWDVFSGGVGAMTSVGVSGGYRVVERVALVAAWHHVRRGSTVTASGTTTDPEGPGVSQFVASFYGNELTAGAKADVSVDGVFLPFVSAQALVMTGLSRFDEDPTEPDNATEMSFASAAPGFLLTGGAEFRFPADTRVQVGIDLELGYGWLAQMEFGDLGQMKAGGFAVRSGVGIRF